MCCRHLAVCWSARWCYVTECRTYWLRFGRRKLADMYNGMARAMRGTDIGDGAATDTRTASP